MAILKPTITVDPDWVATDRLKLYIGSEGAADLASSTPAGGTLLGTFRPYLDPDDTERSIEASYDPTDKCAIVPWGVAVADEAGNETTKWETFDQIRDVPEGVQANQPQSTGNAGEALLTWNESEDV